MNYTIFFIILLIVALISAYTTAFQGATQYWGKKLSIFNQSGMQDDITPKYQNLRNILFISGVLFSFVGGWIMFEWYIGIIALVAMYFFIAIFKAFLPKNDSNYFYKQIIKNLHSKCERYQTKDDSLRVNACKQLIDRLENEKTETLNFKYAGQYKVAKQPRTLKPHNKETWNKITNFIDSKDMKQANFNELNAIANKHLHYGKTSGNSHLFIIYCIRNGWLEKCKLV